MLLTGCGTNGFARWIVGAGGRSIVTDGREKMNFGPKRPLLAVALVVLFSAPVALAQHWPDKSSQPSYPELTTGPSYGLGCSDCGSFSCAGTDCEPNQGWFFQYDRVYWSLSAPDVTTIGDPNEEGLASAPGAGLFFHRNDLDTSFLEDKFKTGNRFDFGRIVGCHGWSMSIVHVE